MTALANCPDNISPAGELGLEAIVLAGGHSSRMGKDKALLPLNGVPLLSRVCEVASACTRQTYVVTPWVDRYSHLGLPAQMIAEPDDPDIVRGPLAGFARGLQVAQSEWVLLLACDLPFLSAASLRQGAALLSEVPPDSVALLRPHPKGWEPLCSFYRRRGLKSVQRAIATGTRSFQGWLSEQAIARWDNADPELFLNCNTPEEWARASERFSTERSTT